MLNSRTPTARLTQGGKFPPAFPPRASFVMVFARPTLKAGQSGDSPYACPAFSKTAKNHANTSMALCVLMGAVPQTPNPNNQACNARSGLSHVPTHHKPDYREKFSIALDILNGWYLFT